MKEKRNFVFRVTIIHLLTYFICGLIFSKLFNYEYLFKLNNIKYFMRDAYSSASLIGILVQIIRGIILGFILICFKDNILKKKNAWLYLWLVFIGLGVICTPAASPGSIEGLIYTKLPLEFHLKILLEIIIQPLLFSLMITSNYKFKISERLKAPMIVTSIAAIGFSLSGIILALALKINFMESAKDPYAFIVMFISLSIVFFMTKLYMQKRSIITTILYYSVCYFSLAVLPTIYNYETNSLLKSPLSLLFSGLPVIAIAIYLIKKEDGNN